MTLNRAYILLTKNCFASGQAYVALSRVTSINNLNFFEYDPTAGCLDPYYKALLEWMMFPDKIADLDSEGNKSAVDIEYPSREAKNLKSSIVR